VKLSEALKRAKDHLALCEELECAASPDALHDLIDAVEETLLAQKKEADLILDLADLRRWGGSE
jgi:hypothetical protein